MTESLPELMRLLSAFIWVFARISGMFLIVPIFGVRSVPMRIRLIVGVLIAALIFRTIQPMPTVDLFSLGSAIIISLEIFIGFAIGFVMKVIFEVIILSGQLMAQQSGLGFAMLVDPQSGMNVPLISQLYLMLCSIIFLSFDGHLVMIQLLTDSFTKLPIGMTGLSTKTVWELISWTKILFAGAVSIALPVIIALLIVYASLGIMSKAAPQLNVFSIGFAITLVFGMFLFVILMPFVVQHIVKFINDGFFCY